jgi:hypothetical protein
LSFVGASSAGDAWPRKRAGTGHSGRHLRFLSWRRKKGKVNPATLIAKAFVERQPTEGLADFSNTARALHQPLAVGQVIASYRAARRKPKRSAGFGVGLYREAM